MNALFRSWDDGREAVAALFPLNRSGEVVALRACIDACRLDSGVLSVAGVSFGYDRAVKANADWERLLDGRTFHMTDLNARRGEFADIGKEDADAIMRGVVGIVRANASSVACVSYDVRLINEAFPKLEKSRPSADEHLYSAFRTPYGPLLHMCMWALGGMARRRDSAGKRAIAYTLEAGDDGQAGFRRFIEKLMDEEEKSVIYQHFLDQYSLASLNITPKKNIEAVFHSADLIAWEWARHAVRHGQGRPMRGSLSALTEPDDVSPDYFGLTLRSGRMFYRHYDQRHANRLVKFLRQTAEAATFTEANAAMSEWEATREEESP